MAFTVSQNGINFLSAQEGGFLLKAYQLKSEQYYTIGLGHYCYNNQVVIDGELINVHANTILTQAQAESLFNADSIKFNNYVNIEAVSKFPNMNQNQFDALFSYTFNRGQGGLQELVRNSNSLAEMSNNLPIYWGGAIEYKNALIARRKREQVLFNTPINFIPRTDINTPCPMKDSKYYYSENTYHKWNYGLPNCTCYAWGRFYEICNNTPKFRIGNAEEWYGASAPDANDRASGSAENGTKYDGYARGQEPALGAVICWEGIGKDASGEKRAGHVAIVEEINPDGSILTSESGWNSDYFWTTTRTKGADGNWGAGSNYKFQGFIYNPIITSDEAPKIYIGDKPAIPHVYNKNGGWKKTTPYIYKKETKEWL